MDWLTLSGGAPSWILIPLGIFYKNQYYTSDECLSVYAILALLVNNSFHIAIIEFPVVSSLS